ncbi:hypothetical protein [uncultured Duncaniella sp.]|uniref:hypothetical protein n=1 Tax=uncultured Duncaniella sp. TaxID=2768039 RepID=UPI00321F6BCE
MRAINLSNALRRNAQVGLETPDNSKSRIAMVHPNGCTVHNVRILRSTIATSVSKLMDVYGDNFSAIIADTDPEIDFERVGMLMGQAKRVFVDSKGNIAHNVQRKQVFYTPAGNVREERAFHIADSNINIDIPLRWTGKLIPRAEAARKFVFVRKYQVKHVNGLTFDFLYGMAKTLAEKDCMMLVGAGEKGIGPLVLSRGALPYRAFLEGRIDGQRYSLILHLTNLELKPIVE